MRLETRLHFVLPHYKSSLISPNLVRRLFLKPPSVVHLLFLCFPLNLVLFNHLLFYYSTHVQLHLPHLLLVSFSNLDRSSLKVSNVIFLLHCLLGSFRHWHNHFYLHSSHLPSIFSLIVHYLSKVFFRTDHETHIPRLSSLMRRRKRNSFLVKQFYWRFNNGPVFLFFEINQRLVSSILRRVVASLNTRVGVC
jgi:hypothetical protein